MGKGSKSTTTSYSGSSNPAFLPYAKDAIGTINSVYNQNAPGLDLLNKQLTGSVIPALNTQTARASGVANQASGYNSDVLSGKYLNGNPYINQIMSQIGEDVTNQVGSHFSTTGRYGSGANQAVMAKQLGNLDSQLRYQNYSDEMNRMGQAAQQAQSASTIDNATLLQAIQQAASQPYTGSESLANSLGALFSGGTDKSTQKGPGLLSSIIGAGASLGSAALMASDERLKTNIVRVGEWDDRGDGLGKYEWNWRSDPNGEKVTGVIASEVKALRPDAYVPNFIGQYAGVNYALLGVA